MKIKKLNKLQKLFSYLLCLTFIFLLAACGGGGSADGQGTLSTSLTDSSSDQYKAVYVTIDRIDVHHDDSGDWETVATPDATYNLLELVNGVVEQLGNVLLDSGHYTQMRLIIGATPDDSLNILDQPHDFANYIIDQADVVHELKVPSGSQTGLKIVNGFDINTNQTTELILDFDALRSVVKAGSSGQYLLKPTVKVLKTANYAVVDGVVTAAETDPAVTLEKTLITAQTAAPTEADIKDQVVIQSGTLTAENGEYALFLEPGDYHLVATRTGYLPACTAVSLAEDSTSQADFSLTAATAIPATISGHVSIADAEEDQHVTIEFRQQTDCSGSNQMITVQTLEIANGGDYTLDLPPGEYQVVASTYAKETLSETINVAAEEALTLDMDF